MNRQINSSWHSDPNGVTLSQMAQYTSSVNALLKLTALNLRIHATRKKLLTGFLMQAIIMVFNFSFTKFS